MIAASVAVVAAAAAGIIIGVNSGDKEAKSREKTNVSSAVSASGESGAASGLTSDDESEIRYHHELYLEYGFDYDGLPEISGNIAWAGGCADNYNTFVVTDNSKVYFKNDYDPFEYYCTIDPDFDEIIPTGPIMDESKNVILLTKNKDGSYTFRNEAKGVKSSFSADALELVKYSNGKLYLYSIDRGDVFVSTVDEDGKTTEKNRVSVKRNDSEPTELTDVKALNHSGKSIFGDNILVLDGSGSLFEVIFDAGSSGELLTENTVSLQPMDDIENIIAQEYFDQLFMYLKSGDQNNTIGIYRH